jgi:hypothetical protein
MGPQQPHGLVVSRINRSRLSHDKGCSAALARVLGIGPAEESRVTEVHVQQITLSAGPRRVIHPGTRREVPDAEGTYLIANRYAVHIEAPTHKPAEPDESPDPEWTPSL